MDSEMLDRLEVLRRNTLLLSNNADQVDLDLLINARRDYRLALDAALPELLSAARENTALKAELAAAQGERDSLLGKLGAIKNVPKTMWKLDDMDQLQEHVYVHDGTQMTQGQLPTAKARGLDSES